MTDRQPKRNEKAQRNRTAIAAAALETFTEKGFAATRIEDVARRAGVAKGTVYLHFASKEALFETIVRDTILPAIEGLATTNPEPDESTRAFAERVLAAGLDHLRAGSGFAVFRLLIAEGGRFPDLAAIYYRTVVEPGLRMLRQLGHRAAARGEGAGGVLEQVPQLAIAPVLMGLLWDGMFERFEALDGRALVRTQLDLLFREGPSARDGGPS